MCFLHFDTEITEQRIVFGPEVIAESMNNASGPSQSEAGARQGSATAAKQRVRVYFEGLREQLKRQETAALAVVDTHIRERLCAIRQQEEDIATILGQVTLIDLVWLLTMR